MAEFVQQSIEEMVGELHEMQTAGLFDGSEIRAIVKKRKAFEYKLRRKIKEKVDFLNYIQYEMAVLALVKKRRKSNKYAVKAKDIEVPIVKRIHKLFDLACTRFKDDVNLWLSHIEFCTRRREKKRVSRLFAALLKIHSRNSDVWILAAKHELESRHSMHAARALLQQAISTNPDSRQLWLEYFRMELLNAEFLRQKIADMTADSLQEEEASAQVLTGEAANVVYRNACIQFPDSVQLCLSFLDIARLFDFAAVVHEAIYSDLSERFATSETAQAALCCRPLQKAIELYNLSDAAAYEVDIRRLERRACKLFDAAVSRIPSVLMWTRYLQTCLEMLQRPVSSDHSLKTVNHALTLFSRAMDLQLLSPQLAQSWLTLLSKTGRVDEALTVSERLTQQFVHDVRLWTQRVALASSLLNDCDEVLTHVHAAIDACITSKDKDAVNLWQILLCWSSYPDKTQSLLERGLLARSSDVLTYVKAFYVDFCATHANIHRLRDLYKRLMSSQPATPTLLQKYVAAELSQARPKMKIIRRAYEEALLKFGANNIDVWLNYMEMESSHEGGKPQNIAHLHWRAAKELDPQLAEEFKQRASKIHTLDLNPAMMMDVESSGVD